MGRKKRLSELTLKDDFMFAAVMLNEENCCRFLEMTLGFPIAKVEVSREKSMVYHPEYKGVRLDVFARDEENTRYNVEMQAVKRPALGRRARYYRGQIDMEALRSGLDYTELPNAYVIFICDFDPFGQRKYCYTFENCCEECPEARMQDGSKSIFLSTCGENESEVPGELVKFLRFVKADLRESMEDFEDEYVMQLQKSIRQIKGSLEMEERFMTLEELLKDERAEGKAEGKAEGIAVGIAESILNLLAGLSPVPEELQERIMLEKNLDILRKWVKQAAKADSIEQFRQNM
jgi:predicted transposase/invertase (TIGR01784 family)